MSAKGKSQAPCDPFRAGKEYATKRFTSEAPIGDAVSDQAQAHEAEAEARAQGVDAHDPAALEAFMRCWRDGFCQERGRQRGWA